MRSLQIADTNPLHKKLVTKIASRVNLGLRDRLDKEEQWQKAEERTLAYMPESEADGVRRNERDNGKPRYTTIQIPYSYALLMSAHTYWTSVFFARTPVHQFTGRHGEGEQQVQALEALIDYQVDVGTMMGPYYIWLYDAGKYGMGILGSYWCKEIIQYGQLAEYTDPISQKTQVLQATMEVEGYQGNKVFNVSPYDFIYDPRVTLARFQEGEFCANRVRIGWNNILRREAQGYYINVDKIKEHITNKASSDGSGQLVRPKASMFFMDGEEKEKDRHPAWGVFWEFYVDLVPSEWGLGSGDYPQKWCFTITEDLNLIIGASPLGYVHGKFPYDVLECEVEGYGQYKRGIPEIMAPIQNVMDWLINTHFFNVRASLNNQFLIDPSKIVVKDTKEGGPGWIWRLRPEAYGSDLDKMFKQINVQDMTRAHMSDLQAMFNIGEKTIGINDQIMGAMEGGGRKTATEVRTSTGFGVNRLKTVSEYMSFTGFGHHAQKLVQSSQQMYDMEMKFRIAGSYAMDAGAQFMMVTPQAIAGSYAVVPVDGVLPVDRMAQANLWKDIMGNLRFMPPQVQAQYDWGKMFAWVANLAGLKNISQFRAQVLPPGMGPSPGAIPMGPGMPGAGPAGAGAALPPPMPPGAMNGSGGTSSTETGNNAYQ